MTIKTFRAKGPVIISYRERFFFSPHVQLKHQSENMDCFFLSTSLEEKGIKIWKTHQDKNIRLTQTFNRSLDTYLHEELGAFWH